MVVAVSALIIIALISVQPIYASNTVSQGENEVCSLYNFFICLEKYSVTVTAVGLLITIILFLLQQRKQRLDNIKKYNDEKYDFLYGLLIESVNRKELLKLPKTNEKNIIRLYFLYIS